MKFLPRKFHGFLVVTLFLTAASSWGQILFSNEITGTNPGLTSPYTEGQTIVFNLTASGISRGEGVVGANANDRYSANSWNTDVLDETAYFEFTITPNEGYEIDFTSFEYVGQRSGTGPQEFALRSSLDGYVSDIYTLSTTAGNFTETVDLSDAEFQNVDEAITFRLYGWGTTNAAGTFSVNSFAFNGTVAEGCGIIPEPTADAQIFCNEGTVGELEAEGAGTIFWYASEDAAEALTDETPLLTGTYYVSQVIGECESARAEVSVTVTVVDAPEVALEIEVCQSGTVADLIPNGEGINWYASETAETPLDATTPLVNGFYFVSQSEGICESTRVEVEVELEAPLVPVGEAEQDFTAGETLADLAVTADEELLWFADEALTQQLPPNTLLQDDTTYYAVNSDEGCLSTALEVTVNDPLSAGSFTMEGLSYYPNPVNNVFNVSYTEAISGVVVYNMLGQAVMAQEVNEASASLDMSALAAGSYFAKVTSGNKTATIKVVKK